MHTWPWGGTDRKGLPVSERRVTMSVPSGGRSSVRILVVASGLDIEHSKRSPNDSERYFHRVPNIRTTGLFERTCWFPFRERTCWFPFRERTCWFPFRERTCWFPFSGKNKVSPNVREGKAKRAQLSPRPFAFSSFADAESGNDLAVAVDALLAKVVEQATTLADHLKQATT